VPITESPNSDQYRRAEYLKAWWGVMNWDKALADFKKP
jgi:superoxide dismutase